MEHLLRVLRTNCEKKEAADSVAMSASPYFLPSPVWLGYTIRILTVLLHKLDIKLSLLKSSGLLLRIDNMDACRIILFR